MCKCKNMTAINKISVKGFRNIESVEIDLQKVTSLLAPNNYGKSNLLDAIGFGYVFMRTSAERKQMMMKNSSSISINNIVAGLPFVFDIEGSFDEQTDFQYGYSFIWAKNNNENNDLTEGYITDEYFKIRDNNGEKPKFSLLFKRTSENTANYNSCNTGRCNRNISIDSNELVLNKLSNYDDLPYHKQIEELLKIKFLQIDTISNPENHFALKVRMEEGNPSLVIGDWLAKYLYDLREKDSDTYEFLISAISNLLPNIESIEPLRLNTHKIVVDNIPYLYPDQYDIMVKESYNNQSTRFQYLSTGSMKLLYLLTCIIRAQREGTQLILIEELENSIHPRLLQSLLTTIEDLLGDVKLIFTSHSPNLAQYLTASQLYVGLPSDKGLVDFRTLKPNKIKPVLKIASAANVSLGEYLFELMLDLESDSDLIDNFFTAKKG